MSQFWPLLCIIVLLQCLPTKENPSVPSPLEPRNIKLSNGPKYKKSSAQPTCDPSIVDSEGGRYKQSLSWALSSVTFFRCSAEISTKLKEMFAANDTGTEKREATQDSVPNICPVFMKLASMVVMSQPRDQQHSLRFMACDQNALSTATIEGSDICHTIALKGVENEAYVDSLQNIPEVGKVFQTLVNLNVKDCSAKCGDGDKSVLCSAFYFLARVVAMQLPMDSPVLQHTKSVPLPKVPGSQVKGSTPQSNESKSQAKVPGSQPKTKSTNTSAKSQPSVDRSEVIRELATPILSLSQNELVSLISADPKLLRFTLDRVKGLSEEQRKKLLGMDDASVVLRMFWIVKIDPVRLRNLTDGQWTVVLKDPKSMFTQTIWFKDPTVQQEVEQFTNLDLVVKYIHQYRKILFAAQAEIISKAAKSKIPQVKGDLTTVEVLGEAGEHGPSGKVSSPKIPSNSVSIGVDVVPPVNQDDIEEGSHHDEEPVPSQRRPDGLINHPVPTAEDRRTQGSERKNGDDPLDNKNGDDPLVNKNGDDTVVKKNGDDLVVNKNGDDLVVNKNGDDPVVKKNGDDLVVNKNGDDLVVKKNGDDLVVKKNGDDPVVKKNGDDPVVKKNGDDPVVKKNGDDPLGETKKKNPLDKKEDLNLDDDLDLPKRSYGPFHFLTLFLIVGGVIVVAYVCMHNRKKLREGVGSYMSGKSKRRRIRDYKPLSTAET